MRRFVESGAKWGHYAPKVVSRSSNPAASALLGATVCALFAMPFLGLSARGDGGPGPQRAADAPSSPPPAAAVVQDGVRVASFAKLSGSGEVLLDEQADSRFEPGAVGDLVLSAGMLLALSPDFRFRTTYWAGGRVRRGTLWGDLVVQGFGDPTVDDVRLKWIARNLALNGVERVTGSIRLDDGYFRTGAGDEELEGEDTEDEEEPPEEETAAEPPADDAEEGDDEVVDEGISALSYHGNRARVVITPTRVGSRASVLVDPDVGHIALFPFVETTPFDRRLRAVTSSSSAGTSVILTGAVSPERGRVEVEVEVGSRSRYFAAALYRHLRREGVRVRRQVTTKPYTGRRRWLIGDYSPPLVELLGSILHGDAPGRGQAIVEALIRTVAVQASGDNGELEIGLESLKTRLVDDVGVGPGLDLKGPGDEGGALSPRHIVTVLRYAHNEFSISADLLRAIGPASTHRVLDRVPDHHRRELRAVADMRAGQLSLAGIVQTPRGPASFAIVAAGDVSPDALWGAVIRRLDQLAARPASNVSRSPSSR